MDVVESRAACEIWEPRGPEIHMCVYHLVLPSPHDDWAQAPMSGALEPLNALDDELFGLDLVRNSMASSATSPATANADAEREIT